jgi:hypothetical protein
VTARTILRIFSGYGKTPILASMGWSAARVDAVAHAIEAHSFSAAVVAETLEAKILQDGDRKPPRTVQTGTAAALSRRIHRRDLNRRRPHGLYFDAVDTRTGLSR